MVSKFSAKRWKLKGKKVPKALASFLKQMLDCMEDDVTVEGGVYYEDGKLLTYISVLNKELVKLTEEQEKYVV